MTESTSLAILLRRTIIAVAVCCITVAFCYLFVDRPVAYFVHNHKVEKVDEFRWLTEPPPIVQAWAPLVLVMLAVRRVSGPWRTWQQTLFIACVSLIVADQFRESLGDICGRYWPETWYDNNPSLIGTGAYGFRPFRFGSDTGSFPSGHAARIVGFAGVFWLMMPRTRWLCVVVPLPMLVALVAMNYHFVSDVIAGGVLGAIIAAWVTKLWQFGITVDANAVRNSS